ncbi:hypothetical protein KL86CLO1_10234 [uncultured Eubacteriales bacterium]|uniref:Uncharacterized protein n=1 Tax=uncultured Eubacteriales bacterium TaxID=172733 RepID=A0A212IYN6_9FIRM|nr:hypothetical protein KL86CLO1_10234 [uncultured Eubacteriales bacterium]
MFAPRRGEGKDNKRRLKRDGGVGKPDLTDGGGAFFRNNGKSDEIFANFQKRTFKMA